MDLKLSPELDALKSTMRRIVQEECIPLEPPYLATPPQEGMDECPLRGVSESVMGVVGTLPKEDWDRLTRVSKETGIYTAHVPTEYDGGGLGALGQVVIDEEAKRSIVPLPISPVPMMLIGACSPEQENSHLWPTILGDKYYAFAQTEPQAGSDPGGMMQTKGVRNGDDWIINGTKMFISGAASADYLLVLAVTDPDKRQRGGITMFMIDNPTPGMSFDPIKIWSTPTKAQQFFVHLDDVRVPNSAIVGGLGGGFSMGQQWLVHHDRILRGSLALGILSRSLAMAIDWAKQRVTYGRPISDRQAIQWMLTDVYMDIIALRAITYQAAWRADQGQDVRVEASMVKYCASEWGFRDIDKIMQIFGGMGETLDMPIPHWYHILRHARIGGGTSEIHRFIMARALLGGTVSWDA